MQFTIPGYEFPTIANLKAYVSENGIDIPSGDKRIRETWIAAIETWSEFQAESIALAADAENEASKAAETIEIAVVSVGSLVVAAVTSEAAIAVYRTVLKAAVLTIVMAFMLTQAALKWLWANKHHAAAYHWAVDWMSSRHGANAITQILIAEWVFTQWVDATHDRLDAVIQPWRDAVTSAMARVGLGGVTIEVQ